jgi:hypothetical protein
MGISRGFRRLTVIAGVLGFLFVCILDLGPLGTWERQQYMATAFVIFAPPMLVLFVGWVVARFKSN